MFEEKESGDKCFMDDHYYFAASKSLDQAFDNCKCKNQVKLHKDSHAWIFFDTQQIKQAKQNVEDRIGPLPKKELISNFVDEYYNVINQIIASQDNKKDIVEVLTKLYDSSNSKIINMVEYMLKCMIASYIDENKYIEIRQNANKPKKRRYLKKESSSLKHNYLFT